MKDFFTAVKSCFLKGENFILVSIVASSGSVPRSEGARMLAGKNGRLWGTIGGALSEHLAIEKAKELVRTKENFYKKYILHFNEEDDIGAKCGGEISVFFRYVDCDDKDFFSVVEKALHCLTSKEPLWLIEEVKIPEDSFSDTSGLSFGIAGEEKILAWTGSKPADLSSLVGAENPLLTEAEGRRWFSGPLVTGDFVYIFGGGHVAQELVPLLDRLNFRCVVFDDRDEFTTPELFPGAAVICGDFKRIGDAINLTERDYAVIVTRGHLWDFDAWAFALSSPALYIGVIGSKTKHAYVEGRLRERGFTAEEIHAPRVHAPIGLDIKSKTPMEIAVSIAAELILTRTLSATTQRGLTKN
ncbi:hypothetical protein AGMMS49928_07590 [Spirochaetia bacterium]|nr:hypothetical protein AGMMS49928_07590 [Spirochaetia bacterium]